MKKLILNWLFGIDNVDSYIKLMLENIDCREACVNEINHHLKTLHEERENLDIIRKLIKVCENHGIDADKEIKDIKL